MPRCIEELRAYCQGLQAGSECSFKCIQAPCFQSMQRAENEAKTKASSYFLDPLLGSADLLRRVVPLGSEVAYVCEGT